jgi:peptidoglycan/LPS O-acetylase OafA/YrhL
MNVARMPEVRLDTPAEGAGLTFAHFPQLDGFRGLAAILVLSGHVLEFSTARYRLQVFGESMAQLGVLLFFVLSGFLITGLLYRERANAKGIDMGRFYARRALRLAPALLLFLGVCFILVKSNVITDIPKYEFVVCLLYLRNIYGRSQSLAHLWSLALEEQFYLVWPWFVKFVRRDRLLTFAICATVLISVFRMVGIRLALFSYDGGVFYERPWFRFDSILIGCCVALALLEGRATFRHLFVGASDLSKTASWCLLFLWTAWGESLSHTFYITLQMIIAALVLCQLILVPKGGIFALFCSAWLRYCGKISYSLYLWQQLFLVVKDPSWGLVRTFPINLLAPFACAMVSYHLVESPALRLKNRFEPPAKADSSLRT